MAGRPKGRGGRFVLPVTLAMLPRTGRGFLDASALIEPGGGLYPLARGRHGAQYHAAGLLRRGVPGSAIHPGLVLGHFDFGPPKRTPKGERPACGARTRKGAPCRAKAVEGRDRCRLHGGCSTGPTSEAGRRAIAESNRRRAEARRRVNAPK